MTSPLPSESASSRDQIPTLAYSHKDVDFSDHGEADVYLRRFEAAWQNGARPTVDDFLPAEEPLRGQVLGELVHIDLERRLKAGEASRLEDYLRRYPELEQNQQAALSLIVAEYRLRRQQDPRVDAASYEQRFPAYQEQLAHQLAAVSPTVDTPNSHGEQAHADYPRIAGYDILEVLGRGGMGIVYKARQNALNRLVALKMIVSSVPSAVLRQRFLAEAHAVARLQHPHIVQVHAIGEHHGHPYLALEFVAGGSLDRQLNGTPLPAQEAAAFVEILARAMQTAHEQGIIHRDLKPANILLASRLASEPQTSAAADRRLPTTPKITDFGLAKLLDQDMSLTPTGDLLGTPSYMAPEQASGQTRDMGPATDIYALGAILYELLTGRPPFKGATIVETLDQVRQQEPVAPRSLVATLPRDLEWIVLKCLRKEPQRRYASAAQLADELGRFQRGEPLQWTRPVGRWERCWRWGRRHPWQAAAGMLTLVLLLTILVSSVLFGLSQARHAADLMREQNATRAALDQARAQEQIATRHRHRAEQQAVELIANRGQTLCDHGDLGTGLLWLARSLEIAARQEATADLERYLRVNLKMWHRYLHPVQGVFPHQGSKPAWSRDGRWLVTYQGAKVFVWDVASGARQGPALDHDEDVIILSLSADGRWLLTGTASGQVSLWSVADGKRLNEAAHGKPITVVAFSPDNQMAVSGGGDAIRFRDVAGAGRKAPGGSPQAETSRPPFTLPLLTHRGVTSASFSPDGGKLLTGGEDGYGRLWNVATAAPSGEPLAHGEPVRLAAFSPDGRWMLTAGATAALWDSASGQLRQRFPLPESAPLSAAAFSPDSQHLLLTSVRGSVHLFDLDEGREVDHWQAQGALPAAAWSPDGQTCLIGGLAGKLWLWSPATGQRLGYPIEHAAPLAAAGFSPNGQWLWSASPAAETVWLHAAANQRLQRHQLPMPADGRFLAFAPDGRTFVITRGQDRVQVLDTHTGQPRGGWLDHPGVEMASYSPDGRVLLTACADRQIRLWQADVGKPLSPPLPQRERLQSVTWSADGRWLLTMDSDQDSQLWEVATGRSVGERIRGPAKVIPRSDGGVDLVRGETERSATARVREMRSGRQVGPTVRQPAAVTDVAVSPDGRALLTSGADSCARLWDIQTGKPMTPPLWHPEPIQQVLYSPDGRRLLTMTLDKVVRLWDAATGAPVGALRHPGQTVELFTFSPDGKFVVTYDSARVIRLWDATLGKPLGPPLPQPGPLTAIHLTNDNRQLWTLGADGTVHYWDVSLRPLPIPAAAAVAWIQVRTALELDEIGVARSLSATAWKERKDKLGK
ncbi:MAG: WD40 repeat domain-containing serine/threonine protein kinase [Gemmataceae bacterium]